MATMVREKRREKKKAKEKQASKSCIELEQPSVFHENELLDDTRIKTKNIEKPAENSPELLEEATVSSKNRMAVDNNTEDTDKQVQSSIEAEKASESTVQILISGQTNIPTEPIELKCEYNTRTAETSDFTMIESEKLETTHVGDTYLDLNSKLARMSICSLKPDLNTEELEIRLESQSYVTQHSESLNTDSIENATPSAPMCEEEMQTQVFYHQKVVQKEVKAKLHCMSLEEAIKLFGAAEMAEVRAMSEREEAFVQAGPVSGADHPLVDLLSTFRSSLLAVERERSKIAHGFSEEQKYRSALWKIEKRNISISEKCRCGSNIELRVVYEHAEFVTAKLPVAKMRLEGLLKDVLDCYCHHQHSALLAHCQIEELILETIQSSKADIREALSLIFQAQRMSDSAPTALATALQRWAAVLCAALLDGGDLRQLLFLIHHLFRQNRSVTWAAKLMRFSVVDRCAAAQAIALLDLLLTRPRLEAAVECTEEAEEVWEEVDKLGQGCVVSSGALRELDLLALLATLSPRHLVARLALFTHADIKQARANDWYDSSSGRGVLRSCAGARALLDVLLRAVRAHAHYERLRDALTQLAADVLHAIAGLHLHTRETYSKDLEEKIVVELEALFGCAVELFGTQQLHKLPVTLLSDDAAKDYCIAVILALHDKISKQLEWLSVELPVIQCGQCVRVVTHAAADRAHDHELARIALDFLLQTGIKRKTSACKGACDSTAREMMPRLLAVHPYLHTTAVHTIADLNQVETVDASSLKPLSLDTWRPSTGEMLAVLEDWSLRCPHLLQHLLLALNYTAYIGVSLETQLTIGTWLCSRPEQEWSWLVLRRLRVHRTDWAQGAGVEVPPQKGGGLLAAAWNLLATDWGHSIPVICTEGVAALCQLAAVRPKDAVQCLAPVMLVMAHSPESIMLTPKFAMLFSQLLDSGPTLVQRALGWGAEPGAELLLRVMLTQLSSDKAGGPPRSALLSAWLHALWLPSLPAGYALLDTALLACREWSHLDRHAVLLLQSSNASEHIKQAVLNAWQAPLLCECLLRNAFALREVNCRLFGRLLDALNAQRIAANKIHVDNALKLIGSSVASSELVIYKTAAALLTAPLHHPSQLTLWRLLFHLYLQRPNLQDAASVGPLFFSGLVNSRTLSQLRKRLQETITYHHNEFEKLKSQISGETSQQPATSPIAKSRSTPVDDNVLPALSIVDLTGESSDSSEESSEEEMEEESIGGTEKKDLSNWFCYHTGAGKMSREYLRWLDEGEKVNAMPHHADIAQFIPEQALDAAWSKTLASRRPAPLPADSPPPAPAPVTSPPATTPFEAVLSRILKIKDRSRRRIRRPVLKSPVEEVNFDDARSLLRLVDKHLTEIDQLAKEWSAQVSQVELLDDRLWPLVSRLRVCQPMPPVRKSCAQKCKPITILLSEPEWCLSTGTEQAIKENRSNASAGIRRVARARPHAARTAAALHVIARRIRSPEIGRSVIERAWKTAGSAATCAPAQTALTALVTDLAEKWVCHDAEVCAALLTRWSGSRCALQQALCGALVAPPRLRTEHWPLLYTALLQAPLPSHAVFSYLSKFDMNRWSATALPEQRSEVLSALMTVAQRWGPAPEAEHHVLLELVGVHSACVARAAQLGALVGECARACRGATLPPLHCRHVVAAVKKCAGDMTFDQLGHLLRELGVIWWEARTVLKPAQYASRTSQYTLRTAQYAKYVVYFGQLLNALQRVFVAAAVALSYAPERVAWYSWSSLVESWSPWISPHPAAAPLLPITGDSELYTLMLRHFVDTVHQVMLDCVGTEEHLLQQTFEWVIQTYLSVGPTASQESRVQMSALLVELVKLPWRQHQWLHANSLKAAVQICNSNDKEITTWCSNVWSATSACTWLRGVEESQLAPSLATLLYLFTGMPQSAQTLEQAALLPWSRLPEVALEEALERFFVQHHDPNMPYHELPQFRVLLQAGELIPPPAGAALSARGACKRARAVSQWTRAACAPTLTAHVPLHCCAVLSTLTDVAPHLDISEGEIEELLSRAVVIMCLEPAAAAALPVWQRWVTSTTPRMVGACLSAVSALTAFEYFAPLADTAARAHLTLKESSGWSEICLRWSACPWHDPSPLVTRTRLYAAYATALTHTQDYDNIRAALLALLANNLNFIENEVILAVWICFACRIARTCRGDDTQLQCASAASSLVARWGLEPRLSLLRVVTLQADTAQPTALHRLLSRFAQCVLTPTEVAARAYESSPLLASNPDLVAWGRAPLPRRLPRLAMMLYPNHETYFKAEFDLAPDHDGV